MKKKQVQLSMQTTTFVEGSPGAYAAHYIHTEEIPKRSALEMAIRSLWAPLGVAIQGGTKEQVEAMIAQCDRTHAMQMDAARAAVQADVEPLVKAEVPTSENFGSEPLRSPVVEAKQTQNDDIPDFGDFFE
jgi:hypothetical protein